MTTRGVHPSVQAVVFDLDDTLASTAHLDDARRSGDRARVRQSLETINIPVGLPEMLTDLQHRVPLAVVTQAPRWYAHLVLNHHYPDVRWSALVAFEDIERRKPYPDALERVAGLLGLKETNGLVYVGDSAEDIEAAFHAGATSVLAAWIRTDDRGFRLLPDGVLPESTLLPAFLESPGHFLPPLEGAQSTRHASPAKSLTFRTVPVASLHAATAQVSVLGRYFAQTPKVRHLHDRHAFSRMIARKDEEGEFEFPVAWLPVLRALIGHMAKRHHVDTVTVIPAKVGRDPRLERLLAQIQDGLGGAWNGEYSPELLRFQADAQRVRHASPTERSRRAMEGLAVQGNAQDKVILVIDDVLTTGATLAAARTRLMEAGAASVLLFSLTATVGDRLFEVEPLLERCPTCGGKLLTLTNRQTRERFLGCLNYRRLHCPYTRKLA